MTPQEREQYKALLAKANEESRAEIARRQEQIAADPLGFNQVQLRDRRARDGEEGDLQYGAVVESDGRIFTTRDGAGGLLYRRGPEEQPAATAEDDKWNRWFGASFRNYADAEREELLDIVSRALGVILKRRDRRARKLERRIDELEKRLAEVVTKTDTTVPILRKVRRDG